MTTPKGEYLLNAIANLRAATMELDIDNQVAEWQEGRSIKELRAKSIQMYEQHIKTGECQALEWHNALQNIIHIRESSHTIIRPTTQDD